jgi:tetratricopeptide (TPR) repeat protein
VLVGREVLLQTGERALHEALGGRGRLLLLAGEAGIGKTTLARAIAEHAAAEGAVVRTGACWESEGLPPFTPWIDVLRHPAGDACAAAARLLESGEHDATDAAGAQRALLRRFSEVADALRDAARAVPQVLVLEDLHWADEPSLHLLRAVAAHLPTIAALIIGTVRDDELPPGSPLASVGGNAERLRLGGLDREAVADLLRDLLGRDAIPSELEQVQRQTSGNPLFVTQVARLLGAGGATVPSGVRDVIERRLARMSTSCDRVLGAAAVLGADFDLADIDALLGFPAAPGLDEAAGAGLLLPLDGARYRWQFVHALVQATRYEMLASEERAMLHTAAVAVLQARPGTSAAVLAHHATRGAFASDDPLPARLLLAAGQEALDRMAWAEATTGFERALAAAPVGPVGDEVRAEAWIGVGAARLRQGVDDVRLAFDEAAALARRAARGDLLARAALGFGVGLGAFEVRLVDHHQIELLEEAATVLGPADRLLPLVLARLSVALAFLDSPERRTELATRAVDLAREAGDPVVLGHALAAWCDAMAGPGSVEERSAAADEIIALAGRAGDLPLELLGRRVRVIALMEGNHHILADHEVAAYERTAERLGDPLYAWYGRLWRATRAHARGELAEAERLVAEAAALGAAGSSVNAIVLTTVHSVMTAVDRRDRVLTDRMTAEMLAALPNTMSGYLVLLIAYVEAVFGRVDQARAALSEVTADLIESVPVDSEWACSVVQLAGAVARTGDERLLPMVRGLLEPIADIGCVEGIGAYLHGSARRFLALLTAVAGDAAATRRHVDAALAAARGGGSLLEALAELDGAWALRRAADTADHERADSLARAAASTFDEIGLHALSAEAAALASGAAGVAAGPEQPAVTREGDVWAWSWDGTTVRVRHAKGVADLALLLERGGREVHVRELEGVAGTGPPAASHQAALDETAVRQYRQRLHDLEEDLDEADRHGDVGRAGRLAAERDALVMQLTAAFGLGGRARRAGSDPDERLRKAVSARVRASIDRIESVHPALGRHLRRAVRTGFWCSYQPESPVRWQIDRG